MALRNYLCDRSTIIQEIQRAHELTRQLQAILLPCTTSATDPISDLFEEIFTCFNVIFSNLDHHERKGLISKKRKQADSWTVTTAVPHDQGYRWKKYGQKQISNSKFQRSYYRCAYRKEQGCLATKTVQQNEGANDPPTYTVSFSKQHTCKTVEASLPFVMDSSSSSRDQNSLKSTSSWKPKDMSPIFTDFDVGDYLEFDDMLMSGPESPVFTPTVRCRCDDISHDSLGFWS